MKQITLFLLLLIFSSTIFSQNRNIEKIGLENLERKINYPVLVGFGTANIISLAVLNNYNRKTIWQNKSDFRFSNYFNKYSMMDKLGHFYSSNLLLHIYSASLEGANIEIEQTFLYGGIIGLLVQTYGEYKDGKTSGRGFNYGDYAFDILGTGFAVAQYYYPYLKNIQPRFSYSMSEKYVNSSNGNKNIFNDYNGQIYWLAFKVNRMFPEKLSTIWPDWLMLSIGYGVSNLNERDESKELYLSFDVDVEEVIPYRTPVWQFLINTLNYFHFPLPGIKISNNKVQLTFGYKGLF